MMRALATVVLITWGCASSGTDPHDMSADDHRRAAESHGDEADQHAAEYDPDAEKTSRSTPVHPGTYSLGSPASGPGGGAYYYSSKKYNPTATHLEHADKHQRHADAHAAAAKALESYEDAECKSFPGSTRKHCPLMGNVVAVEDIDEPAHGAGGPAPHAQHRWRGVRIRFADGVNMDAVVAHARCHMAFAATHGFEGMDHCPLYIKGTVARQPDKQAPASESPGNARISKGATVSGPMPGNPRVGGFRAERGKDPHTLDLLVDDEAQLEELRRRAKAHISTGKHKMHKHGKHK